MGSAKESRKEPAARCIRYQLCYSSRCSTCICKKTLVWKGVNCIKEIFCFQNFWKYQLVSFPRFLSLKTFSPSLWNETRGCLSFRRIVFRSFYLINRTFTKKPSPSKSQQIAVSTSPFDSATSKLPQFVSCLPSMRSETMTKKIELITGTQKVICARKSNLLEVYQQGE